MKNIRVFIERGNDGTYGAYMPDENNLTFGTHGDGATADAAKNDFLQSVDDIKAYYKENGKEFPNDIEFSFGYDVPSFISYYSDKFTLAGLERITGVARGQLSHYVTGRRNPSPKTAAKIQNALHAFAKDLSQVHFV